MSLRMTSEYWWFRGGKTVKASDVLPEQEIEFLRVGARKTMLFDLSEYDQKGDYQKRLLRLSKKALAYLQTLQVEQLRAHKVGLKRECERIANRQSWYLKEFIPVFQLTDTDLVGLYIELNMKLTAVFIVDRRWPLNPDLSTEDARYLAEALMIKHGVLQGLIGEIEQIEEVMQPHPLRKITTLQTATHRQQPLRRNHNLRPR